MTRSKFLVFALVGLISAAALAWFFGHRAGSGPLKPAASAIPVEITKVTRGDLPIYVIGLGTVQAYNTVTLTPRVDGQIDKVAFVEGQDVKRGDLLVQIDPRPFKAAL